MPENPPIAQILPSLRETVAQCVQAQISNKSAIIRRAMPLIHAAREAGYNKREILEAMNAEGLAMTYPYFLRTYTRLNASAPKLSRKIEWALAKAAPSPASAPASALALPFAEQIKRLGQRYKKAPTR